MNDVYDLADDMNCDLKTESRQLGALSDRDDGNQTI